MPVQSYEHLYFEDLLKQFTVILNVITTCDNHYLFFFFCEVIFLAFCYCQSSVNETSSRQSVTWATRRLEQEKTVLSQRVGIKIWHCIVLHGQFKCHLKTYCECDLLHPWTYCKRVAKFQPAICETTEGSAEGEGCRCFLEGLMKISEAFSIYSMSYHFKPTYLYISFCLFGIVAIPVAVPCDSLSHGTASYVKCVCDVSYICIAQYQKSQICLWELYSLYSNSTSYVLRVLIWSKQKKLPKISFSGGKK